MAFSSKKRLKIQPPRAKTRRLNNNAEITIAEGCRCSWCGDTLGANDAEPLEHDAVRLICRCGQLILLYEPRP